MEEKKIKDLSIFSDEQLEFLIEEATKIKKDRIDKKISNPKKQNKKIQKNENLIEEDIFDEFNINGKQKLISIKNLSKNFGDQDVLKNINLDLYEGETLALVGANGAGKTVLMEILVGLIKPSSGKINFTFPNGLNHRKEIGMQFQDNEIKGSLKAKDLINFYKLVYKEKKITSIELDKMKSVFGIEGFINKKISKLSGGQKQRINLFLAIMSRPKLIILDEFITGLDITSVLNILNYIKKQKEETNATLIIISHQPEEIKMLASRIVVLNKGVITRELTVKQALKENNHNMTEFLAKEIA